MAKNVANDTLGGTLSEYALGLVDPGEALLHSTEMARMGRPPSAPGGVTRNRQIGVAVTDEEYDLIRRLARQKGRSVADLMRILGLAAALTVRNPGAMVRTAFMSDEDFDLYVEMVRVADKAGVRQAT